MSYKKTFPCPCCGAAMDDTEKVHSFVSKISERTKDQIASIMLLNRELHTLLNEFEDFYDMPRTKEP